VSLWRTLAVGQGCTQSIRVRLPAGMFTVNPFHRNLPSLHFVLQTTSSIGSTLQNGGSPNKFTFPPPHHGVQSSRPRIPHSSRLSHSLRPAASHSSLQASSLLLAQTFRALTPPKALSPTQANPHMALPWIPFLLRMSGLRDGNPRVQRCSWDRQL
jgi:hypothetical protein